MFLSRKHSDQLLRLLSDVTFLPADRKAENILRPSSEEETICAGLRALAETLDRSGGGRTEPLSGQIDPLSSLACPLHSLVTVAKLEKQRPPSIGNTC